MGRLGSLVFPLLTALLAVFLISAPVIAADDKIAIFTFKINSEKQLDFLQNGISDTLFGKLSTVSSDVVKKHIKTDPSKESVLENAKALNAFYAVTGSVSVFGSSVNLNAFLYRVSDGETMLVFNRADTGMDILFQNLDDFAGQVVSKITGSAVQSSGGFNSATASQADNKKGGLGLKTSIIKSPAIKSEVVSMATGDIDGDGAVDLIFTDEKNIYSAKQDKGLLNLKKIFEGKHYLKNMSIDLFDTDKDGKDEIFVTSVHRTSLSLQSYVLEIKDGKLQKSIQKAGWFFSVKKLPQKNKKILTGQKKHYAEAVFANHVYELLPDKKEGFIENERLQLPPDLNIYDFAYGDLMKTGKDLLVAYTPGDKIAVYDEENKGLWKSSSFYGGSMRYLETKKGGMTKRFYISPRISIDDIDNDGVNEMLTIFNHNTSPRAFVNLKNFKSGNIVCLSWSGLNVEKEWETPDVSGYISDFALSDINGDGEKDLVYAVVSSSGSLWKKKKSFIVIQKIKK